MEKVKGMDIKIEKNKLEKIGYTVLGIDYKKIEKVCGDMEKLKREDVYKGKGIKGEKDKGKRKDINKGSNK